MPGPVLGQPAPRRARAASRGTRRLRPAGRAAARRTRRRRRLPGSTTSARMARRVERCVTPRQLSRPAAATSAAQPSSLPTNVSWPRLERAVAIARSSVHSHASARTGATNVIVASRSRTRMTEARRSSSPSSSCRRVWSTVAARIASAASAVLRVASGNGCPTRIVASAPNGTCSSSSAKPCMRAAALMPRLACAITSGPIPSPARHAIEYAVTAPSPPGRAHGSRRPRPRRRAP